MQQEEKEVLAQSAQSITDKTITVNIDILSPTWWQQLFKMKVKKFQIKPICLGTLIMISEQLLSIDIDSEQKDNIMILSQKLMIAHSSTLAYVVALAIVNRKKEPPQSLVEFLQYNLTAQELSDIAKLVLKQMDISNFIASIISIKGTSVLEMSLTNRKS